MLQKKKSLVANCSVERQESMIAKKKQKLNGTIMNFLIDASNRTSFHVTNTAQDRLKEFQLIKKSILAPNLSG